MYVIVQHQINNPETAFSRGENLIKGEGAPPGARVLQFYPSRDRTAVACLWESDSVEAVQEYVDGTLGGSSDNEYHEVDAARAFSEQPLGVPASAPIGA